MNFFLLDSNQRSSAPMIIGIAVTSCFLMLSLLIIVGIFCCRWKKNQLTDTKTNKCKIEIRFNFC